MFYNTDNLNDGEIYLKLYKTADEDIAKGYVPEWHDMYKEGKKRTCRYIKNIG